MSVAARNSWCSVISAVVDLNVEPYTKNEKLILALWLLDCLLVESSNSVLLLFCILFATDILQDNRWTEYGRRGVAIAGKCSTMESREIK
jgi:hypothetical protein